MLSVLTYNRIASRSLNTLISNHVICDVSETLYFSTCLVLNWPYTTFPVILPPAWNLPVYGHSWEEVCLRCFAQEVEKRNPGAIAEIREMKYVKEAAQWVLLLGTNLIHDFTAVTFSVKLAFFREKRRFPWSPWFFVNFSAFSSIYDNSRVLSAAFVRMLLFATSRTSALSSWHWLSWVLT